MRRIPYLLLALLMTLASCKKELDMTVMHKTIYEGTAFEEVAVEDAWDVTLVQDSLRRGVEIEYSAFLEQYLKIRQDGDQLQIGFTNRLNLPSATVFRATVYVGNLRSVELSEASHAKLEGTFRADDLTVTVREASVLQGGDFRGAVAVELDAASTMVDFSAAGAVCRITLNDASVVKGRLWADSQLFLTLDDASRMTLYGVSAPKATVSLHAASVLNMVEVEVGEMEVDMNAASEASVNVSGALRGSLHDASVLYYEGHPDLDLDCDPTSSYHPL